MVAKTTTHFPVEKKEPRFAAPHEYIGRLRVWTMEPRGQETVTWLVKIVDARKRGELMDLLVETNTGDKFWTSIKTVRVIRQERE